MALTPNSLPGFGEWGFVALPRLNGLRAIAGRNRGAGLQPPPFSSLRAAGLIGPMTHASSDGLLATLDINKLVTRHAAIVGSTGSGKSNTVAAIMRALVQGSYPSAKIVVIDPHGEYGAALSQCHSPLKRDGSTCQAAA